MPGDAFLQLKNPLIRDTRDFSWIISNPEDNPAASAIGKGNNSFGNLISRWEYFLEFQTS
jgi:hypothetical protein